METTNTTEKTFKEKCDDISKKCFKSAWDVMLGTLAFIFLAFFICMLGGIVYSFIH